MISIKKHMDGWTHDAPAVSSLHFYRSLLAAVGKCSHRAVPDLGHELERKLSKLDSALEKDPLTGLANRRGFEERLDARMRTSGPFCLILIDLNGFKAVNDRLGHLAGDDVLKNFAASLRAQFPPADLVARWGGDEFAAIVNGGRNDAEALVDRIRRSDIGECKINGPKQTINVAVQPSIGLAEWDGSEKGPSLLARADHAMYQGKQLMKTRRA